MRKKESTKAVRLTERESLILKLAQCHIIHSATWQANLFTQYNITSIEAWDNLSIEQLKEMEDKCTA